jgi:hypothetical protein
VSSQQTGRAETGCTVLSSDEKSIVIRHPNGTEIPFAENADDKLYYVWAKRDAIAINEAHRRIGHCDEARVRAFAKQHDWKLTGDLRPCEACMQAKARAKGVAKTTTTSANINGERIFIYISGPYAASAGKNKYWLAVVDDNSRRKWSRFISNKSDIAEVLRPILLKNKKAGFACKFIRCDNAGENLKHLEILGLEPEMTFLLEHTAPNTPQMNGVVERAFVTIRDKGFSMMLDAKLTPNARKLLWSHAMDTATILDNLLPRRDSTTNAYQMWGERTPVDRHDLKEWGRIAYVTKRERIKPKLTPKAVKCIFVGYTVSHSSDAFYFYCTTTNRIIISRDVKWLEWHGTSALTSITQAKTNIDAGCHRHDLADNETA